MEAYTLDGHRYVVDDGDAELTKKRWWYREGTLVCYERKGGKKVGYRLRALIAKPGRAEHVEHRNGDVFDFRRENLVVVRNVAPGWRPRRNEFRRPQRIRGIRLCGDGYVVRVGKDEVFVGVYKTADEAARAYDEARERLGIRYKVTAQQVLDEARA